ncbi:MAG: arginine--tRNA ligase [Pseudomonadota bacterium]
MSILASLNECFGAALAAVSGRAAVDAIVQPAGRPEFGDYQVNGVMGLAKSLGRPPREVAQQVIERVSANGLIDRMEVAGPGFINVTLANSHLVASLQGASQSERLGVGNTRHAKVVVDYSSVNLAKEMHVGHLRSTIIGDALARVHEFLGHEVVRQNHVGDWGTQFGMLVAFLVESRRDNQVAEVDLSDLEAFYRLAKARFEDPAFADVARQYVVRLQAGDPEVIALWRHFVDVSMSHCEKVYQRLGVQLTRADVRGESAYNDDLPGLVDDLHRTGVARLSEGADVVLVEEFKGRDGEASSFMVRKKDGGYMYGTTDLAAVRHRAQVLQATRCLYVVDSRQALHFQQLFLVARRAGFVAPDVQLEHIAFGMVLDKAGKPFKTRQGESIKLIDLLNEAVQRAVALVTDRNPDMPADQRQAVGEAVGIGAVKYADLSKNRTTDYVFDWDTMLSFEGNTAPYLQYACARVHSLVRRVGATTDLSTVDFVLQAAEERALALHLVRFNDALQVVARDSTPHVLCAYLYELAAVFSRFYEQCKIIGADGAVDLPRLKLSKQAARTLTAGLQLLGITALEQM